MSRSQNILSENHCRLPRLGRVMKLWSPSFDPSSSSSSTSASPVSIMGGSQHVVEAPVLVSGGQGQGQSIPDPRIYGHMTPVEVENTGMQMNISLTLALDRVWHGEFARLFSQYLPDHWFLRPGQVPEGGTCWSLFQDSAKVRFNCAVCGRCWTSMKGRVAFWYSLVQLQWHRVGNVHFKLYGQSCKRCQQGAQPAMWYPEEVLKVVGNVYNRVGQVYYNFRCPPLCVSRRQGRPREQHDSRLCQACQDGLCRREWAFREFRVDEGSPQATKATAPTGPGPYNAPAPPPPAVAAASAVVTSPSVSVPLGVLAYVTSPPLTLPVCHVPPTAQVTPTTTVTSYPPPPYRRGPMATQYPPIAGPQVGNAMTSYPPPGNPAAGPIVTSYTTATSTSPPPSALRLTSPRVPSEKTSSPSL